MSRLNKANEIIELAILMQNSYIGLTLDDIAKEFECSRRSHCCPIKILEHTNETK